MHALGRSVDTVADASGFSGVVRVDRGGEVELTKAYGFAHRGYEIPNAVDTQFAIASGTKGLTAVAVVSLIEDGSIGLSTTARSVLGQDLPLIGDNVTIEHLLSHRSGIGDYLDEEVEHDLLDAGSRARARDDRAVPRSSRRARDQVPARRTVRLLQQRLRRARVDRRANERSTVSRPRPPAGVRTGRDARYGISALRRASRKRSARVCHGRQCVEANVFHLPVRGSGDGGIYATVADFSSFWSALFAGRLVSADWVAEMVRPHSEKAGRSMRYGFGFWLDHSSDVVMLEGCDPGVSFRSVHDPERRLTHTVISNTSDGAWPITRLLAESLSA